MKKLKAALILGACLLTAGCRDPSVQIPFVVDTSGESSSYSSFEPPKSSSASVSGSSVPESSKISENSSVPESSSIPESSGISESSSVSESSKAPESSKIPESSTVPESSKTPEIPSVPKTESYDEAAGRILSEMTLREKIGQLFIVRPEALAVPYADLSANYRSVSAVSEEMRKNFAKFPVGGVALFADNIITPAQTSAFTGELSGACEIPLFIAVDEEGGRVARLANNAAFGLPKYDSAAAVGRSGNPSAALEMGNTIGGYLKKYGFNMDFAPDADVFTNPKNTILGNRAFSSDAATAAIMASAMAQGLRNNGIIPVYKHFPGHGDTAEDSHTGAAYANKTHAEMELCEWLPFLKATPLDGIMAGHISAPNITGDNVPATMSKQMITDILRGELGFDGLIITDSLAMGAVKNRYGSGLASVNAILAGCDILLMPDSLGAAFDGILAAVNDGTISEQRLNESVLRILKYKLEYNIIEI